MNNMAHGHHLRLGRHSLAGQIYLVTMVTGQRQPVFADLYAARALIGVLREEERLERALTWAFVLMPDHLHWLMQLGTKVSLSGCVQGVKSMCSRRMGRSVWQAGFHDRALRREEDMRSVARYIVANPLRAGLAEDLGSYPHWDARWMRGDHDPL